MVGKKTLILSSLLVIVVLCGCSLFSLHDDATTLVGNNTKGSANVAFNIVVPGHANLAPTVRAAATAAKVTFRITLLQPGNGTSPTITFLKTAAVQSDGSAEATFSGLPEGSAIGEIAIEGGNIGGKSMFHGASDLFPGNNTVTVSPKGSRHESDILANAMLSIAANPDLIKISKPNLVTNVANAAATLIANPTEDVYALVFEKVTNSPLAFDAAKYTQIDISASDGTMRAMGLTSWSATPAQFWQGTTLAGAGLLPVSVSQQGIGDYAIVAWENPTRSSHAFSKLSTTGGTLLNYLQTSATTGFVLGNGQVMPGDGTMVIAGIYNGRPALVRWSGKDNTDLTSGLSTAGVTWNTVFEIDSVGAASATITYLEYDKTGTGKILCAVKDPAAGTRLFHVDPVTGTATEQQQNNNFGLWAQVGSGTIALGWDGLDAAASYKVYYATGTALATETAPVISTTEKVLLFENFINSQTYTFQVSAIASDGRNLAWSMAIQATPVGATNPIIYSNWKLATNTYEIGSTALANVKILSYNDPMLSLEITGTTVLTTNSIITGLYNNQPISVKLLPPFGMPGSSPPPPPGGGPQVINATVSGASMQEVFSECKYVFRGRMSQLPAMSERLLNSSDPMYQSKISYLRGAGRPSLRAGFTSPLVASPSYGALSPEMENFELDPDVVVNYETSFGRIVQFEMRVDGYASCEIYAKFLASSGVELPAIEGTLLPHQEIPFFVGPVPGTWGREVTASWKFSLNAELEVKAGTKMRVDFRSGVNYLSETGWNGQLLWRIKNSPILEAKLKGTFTNEAAIEMKNSLKVGGLAGPELTLKPYIKSEATVSSEKPCQVDAALSMGMQGSLKAIVQAWSYNIGEWGSTFEPFGPWVIASQTLSANATPTLKVTGPYNLENKLAVRWPNSQLYDPYQPHVFTSTGTDSIAIFMDDSKGLYSGLSKVEVSVDGNPAFLSFALASDTHAETGIALTPFPLQATLTLSLPLTMDDNMLTGIDERYSKWYTPFRLPPGPHEIMFKVYDKCGDHSIATHAVWVKAEEDIWKVQNDVGSISWEVGINGFKKGTLPEQVRKIEPVAGGLDLSPLKHGPVKSYNTSGELVIEGAFTNNVRSGIWKRHRDEFSYSDSVRSYFTEVEFDSNGQPMNWLQNTDYVYDSTVDYYAKIRESQAGPAQFAFKVTDPGYLHPGFEVCSFTAGLRTLGLEAATMSYNIETFAGGLRNGIATTSYYQSSQVVETFSGEYLNNQKNGKWVKKYFLNLTELQYTLENTFASGIVEGPAKYSSIDGTTITGNYTQGLRSGSWTQSNGGNVTTAEYLNNNANGPFSSVAANGNHVSGSYVNGYPVGSAWPIYNSANQQVGTHTPVIDANSRVITDYATITPQYYTPEAHEQF